MNELLLLIENAPSHRIVKLLYHCELTNDFSEKNQINYLKSF
jgi:hypothetical protein